MQKLECVIFPLGSNKEAISLEATFTHERHGIYFDNTIYLLYEFNLLKIEKIKINIKNNNNDMYNKYETIIYIVFINKKKSNLYIKQ